MEIWAGIITYNPDVDRLKKVIMSVVKQVETLIVFDNCSKNYKDIEDLCKEERIRFIRAKKNMGIAFASNQIMKLACENDVDWVMLLDHDSVCETDHINMLKKYIRENVGIICPLPVDKRKKINTDYVCCQDAVEVEDCIQSGAIYSCSVWEKVSGFDEWYVVDYVDRDYCMRVRLLGEKIIRVNSVRLDQEFGTIEFVKYKDFIIRIADLMKSKTIYALSYRPVAPVKRIWYVTRNRIVFLHKYRKHLDMKREIIQTIKIDLLRIVRGKKHFKIMYAIISATAEGIRCCKGMHSI